MGMERATPLQISRRFFGLIGFKAACFGVLAARLYQLQIRNGLLYRMLSDKNRLSLRLISPIRGDILDRFGSLLATEKNVFRALLQIPKNTPYQPHLYTPLFAALNISPEDQAELHLSLQTHGITLLKASVSWTELIWLEEHKEAFPTLTLESIPIRHYNYPLEDCHILGYMGLSSVHEENALYTGKSGVEKAFQETLQGTAGYRTVEINAHHKIVRQVETFPPCAGEKVPLALHQPLQTFLAKRLREFPSASVVVLKVDTGEIVSTVSTPGFDANVLSYKVSAAYWKNLLNEPHTPLVNKAFSGLYPPGSTIKMAVALEALEKGIINAYTTFTCHGFMMIAGHKFHCWCKRGHGPMNVVSALAQSCDVFFYTVATRLNRQTLAQTLRVLGFGEAFLPEFQEIQKGLVPTPEWKLAAKRGPWVLGDTVLMAIGQGAVLATPLQLAVMTARLASGLRVAPTVILSSASTPAPSLPFEPEHLRLIRQGLYQAVNESSGTGFPYRCRDLLMSGKTATSQVRKISQHQRRLQQTTTHHLDWHNREHSIFCGYAPSHAPKYAAVVLLEHAIKGAAGIAGETFSFLTAHPA